MPVDRGGVLSLVGAIADENGNLSEPLAQHPVETEPDQILLFSPVLLRGDRVLVNLKMGASTGPGLKGNPAVALYAPPEGLFLFALEPFEGAAACDVVHGRADCSLEGSVYTLFSERPITGGNQESKIWVLHVAKYISPRTPIRAPLGNFPRDGDGWVIAGDLRDLLTELRVVRD